MVAYPIPNGIAYVAQASYGIGTQIAHIVHDKDRRLRFFQNGTEVASFDLILSENHSLSALPSAFPTEKGGQVITDNIVVSPREVNVTGLISDNPTGTAESLIEEGATTLASIAGPIGVTVAAGAALLSQKASNGSTRRSVKRYETLLRIASGGVSDSGDVFGPSLVDVLFPQFVPTYKNMAIASISCELDASTGDALVVTMSLREVRTVNSQTLILSALALAATKISLGTADAAKASAAKIPIKASAGGIDYEALDKLGQDTGNAAEHFDNARVFKNIGSVDALVGGG